MRDYFADATFIYATAHTLMIIFRLMVLPPCHDAMQHFCLPPLIRLMIFLMPLRHAMPRLYATPLLPCRCRRHERAFAAAFACRYDLRHLMPLPHGCR